MWPFRYLQAYAVAAQQRPRVDRVPVPADLDVQVWAGGEAGRPDPADQAPGADDAVAAQDPRQVRVVEDQAVCAHADRLAVAGDPAGGQDAAARDGTDGRSVPCADVDAGVEAAPPAPVAGRHRSDRGAHPQVALARPRGTRCHAWGGEDWARRCQ